MVSANLVSGLSMDILILYGDAPPPPAVLAIANFLDMTFIPIVFIISVGFTLWYERPIRDFIARVAAGRTIAGKLGRQARQRLLNEPFMLLMVSLSLWLYATLIYSGLFWLSGAGPIEIHRALFRSMGTGLITVVVAFFLLESILQRWLAPVFFPNGGLSKTPRVLRIRLGIRLGALLLACNVVPLVTIAGSTLRIISSSDDPVEIANILRTAIFHDAAVFIVVGAFLTWIVSRNITRSMDEITRVLKHIRNDDLDQKVRVTASDEIGYAGDVINEMAEGLKERDAMRQSLNLAREVQQQLLPPTDVVTDGGLQISGRSVYCDETGGDYFDIFPIEMNGRQCVAVTVGDVAGHGVPSALLMATVRGALRQRAILPGTPEQMITDVNRQLVRDVRESGQFMTLFFAVFDQDRHTLTWVRAGHDPAIVYDPPNNKFETLRGEGTALGISEASIYASSVRTAFASGQIMLIGTDGIWEARNDSNDMFGKKALRNLIRRYAQHDARDIRDAILEALDGFQTGVRAEDDITLIVVKKTTIG
jgi:sigma-B regulation protein RsbU (phosphoserine phosphatase)